MLVFELLLNRSLLKADEDGEKAELEGIDEEEEKALLLPLLDAANDAIVPNPVGCDASGEEACCG